MKSGRKRNTNKGYNRTLKYSNGLELQFHDLQLHGYFSRYVKGYSAKISSRKGWTDRQVVNVLSWDINDVLMTVRHKGLTSTVCGAVDLAIDYYHEF